MSKRYPGGLITKTPVVPTTSAASGVWTLDQAITYIQAGTWPVAPGPYWIGVLTGATVGVNTVAVDSSSNVYIGGLTDTAGNVDFLIAKYNKSGIIQWQRRLGGSASDVGRSIAVDASGNVYIAGYALNGSFYACQLAKYNTSGALQWQQNLYDSTSSGLWFGIVVDSSGNIYLVGYSGASGANQIQIAKYNTSGTLQWQRKLANISSSANGNGIAVDSSGNVYITGYSTTSIGGQYVITAKYNSSGTLQWQRQIGDGSFSYVGYAIAVDASGNAYVTGTVSPAGLAYDIIIAKYDTSGTIQWQRSLSGAQSDQGFGIAVDSSSNVYIAGVSGAVQLAKYNSSGTIQWQRRLGDQYSNGITVDSFGNFYVTSYGGNFTIAKLPVDGSLTGTYTVNGNSVSYAASTLTDTATSFNTNTSGLTDSVTTLTSSTSTLTDAATTLTSSVTTL